MSFVDMLLETFKDVDIVSLVLFTDITLLVFVVNVSLLVPADNTLVVSLVNLDIGLLIGVTCRCSIGSSNGRCDVKGW